MILPEDSKSPAEWSAADGDIADQLVEVRPEMIDPSDAMRLLRIADDQPEADVIEQHLEVAEDDEDY
jgi:hypothetical protein